MSATEVSVSIPINSTVKQFESLPDSRHQRNRRHLLIDVITHAVCGVIVGCSGPSTIARWARTKKDRLNEVLVLLHGMASRNCIRRILCALKPEAFQSCFQIWVVSLVSEVEEVRPTIAVDGKTMRRPYDRNRGLAPLHLAGARGSEHSLALGQVAILG